MDHSPVRVSGAVVATRARVLWRDATLFVARAVDDVVSLPAASVPTRLPGNAYTVTGDEGGEVTWRRYGCKCGCQVCRVPSARLVAAATPLVAVGAP